MAVLTVTTSVDNERLYDAFAPWSITYTRPGSCRLNLVLLESFFDPPAQLPAHAILFVGAGFHQHQIFRLAVAHAVDARHLNVADNIIGKCRDRA